MDGDHKSIAVGLGTYRSVRVYKVETTVNNDMYASPLGAIHGATLAPK